MGTLNIISVNFNQYNIIPLKSCIVTQEFHIFLYILAQEFGIFLRFEMKYFTSRNILSSIQGENCIFTYPQEHRPNLHMNNSSPKSYLCDWLLHMVNQNYYQIKNKFEQTSHVLWVQPSFLLIKEWSSLMVKYFLTNLTLHSARVLEGYQNI